MCFGHHCRTTFPQLRRVLVFSEEAHGAWETVVRGTVIAPLSVEYTEPIGPGSPESMSIKQGLCQRCKVNPKESGDDRSNETLTPPEQRDAREHVGRCQSTPALPR